MTSTRGPTGAGSSPLARGLHAFIRQADSVFGIIPARAGFTWRRPWPTPPRPDHPRSRGVYLMWAGGIVCFIGSSPLARGLMVREAPAALRDGIIPARAGFTRRHPRRRRPEEDHPRSRGVYLIRIPVNALMNGSSPLARGLQPGRRPQPGAALDHPRSRGVYAGRECLRPQVPGSSPLARGLHSGRGSDRGRLGIIPARAGFTSEPRRR